jgi:hypothetical protein
MYCPVPTRSQIICFGWLHELISELCHESILIWSCVSRRAQRKIVTAEKDMEVVNKVVKFTEKSRCAIVSPNFAAKLTRKKQGNESSQKWWTRTNAQSFSPGSRPARRDYRESCPMA